VVVQTLDEEMHVIGRPAVIRICCSASSTVSGRSKTRARSMVQNVRK
jgi:hypothetical protein